MEYQDVRVETRGDSSWIYLNRPEQMNAIRPQTHPELIHAFEQADADPKTSFIVFTGAGRGFCAGDDFQEIFFSDDGPGKRSDASLNRYRTRHGAATPPIRHHHALYKAHYCCSERRSCGYRYGPGVAV